MEYSVHLMAVREADVFWIYAALTTFRHSTNKNIGKLSLLVQCYSDKLTRHGYDGLK